MLERQTMQRKRRRFWPFYRYAGCWWQHPYYCQLPDVRSLGKPTNEDDEDVKNDNNMLDQVLNFARTLKRH